MKKVSLILVLLFLNFTMNCRENFKKEVLKEKKKENIVPDCIAVNQPCTDRNQCCPPYTCGGFMGEYMCG